MKPPIPIWKLIAYLTCFLFLLVVFTLYGTAFICMLLGIIGIGIYHKRYETAPELTEHGSAKWTLPTVFEAAGNGDPKGLWLGAGFIRGKHSHLLTIAPSGQGKGTCLIIPNLLIEPSGSYVVTDPKGENAFITARFQKEKGQRVFIIDPWEEQKRLGATHGIAASGFNPFVFIKMHMEELRDNCEQVANYLVPDKPNTKEPYWDDRARALIKTLLMHIITALPEKEHNFWTLYKMLRLTGDDWLGLLADLKMNDAEDGLISIAAGELIGIEKAGTTMAGIVSNAQNATTIFESPQLKRSLEANDFNPYWLTEGNCTVYIVIPERYLDTHSVWLRLVFGLCLKACNAKPDKRVYFLLDEFPILGRMKDIERGFAFGRGQNISLWIFTQNLSQIKAIYGEDGMNNFISNSSVLQSFGSQDNFTNEYISNLLGDSTRQKETVSGRGENRSVRTETYARKLLTPEEVSNSPYIITIADKMKVQIIKQPYFKKIYECYSGAELKAMPYETIQKMTGGEPPYAWTNLFMSRADDRPREIN